ncbi:hypothetical protein AKJ45_00960 [candidate division MSBL1 archaeon SCGC-AAA261F19]|uniref:Uncharacterized protein n=2 Tax=candidate division MSBL1 TaxID=215777 RepID=A0A133VB82_9EURY|nr:hypothetical protein AKJ43_03210 [candidate division MSBL1 archaeon SCGC-AAA261D19]KXB03667.1 hypothetical protein AKJ45_00960 [candidate division MSBL1 archaeon SCGC-AAA261F19]
MSVFRGIDEGDLLGPNLLEEMIGVALEEGVEVFSIDASLQDYIAEDFAKICKIKNREEELKYRLKLEWPEDFNDKGDREQEKSRLRDTFIRGGIAKHSNLSHIMKRLREHDDVIVGLDTNVLLDCAITSVLMDEFYAEDFPNWILLVIPKIGMAEIENKANQKFTGPPNHPRLGWPQYDGRIGQRALQEILELDKKDSDRPGLSIMTVGELKDPETVKTSDNWWKDSEIRSQFQKFLRNISFHKGTYFISQDRVNVMMSGAEGTEGLYLQKPDLKEFESGKISKEEFRKFLYELCVQFGEIKVNGMGGSNPSFQLSIFWPEKHVSDWRESKLKIKNLKKAM